MKKIRIIAIIMTFLMTTSLFACKSDTKNNAQVQYDVNNDCFSIATFEPRTYTTVDFKEEKTTYEYVLRIKSTCSVSLYEFTANIKIYSSNESILKTESIHQSKNISANNDFYFDIVVSEKVQTETKSVDVIFSGKSHDNPNNIKKFNITYIYNNGLENKKVIVDKGKTLVPPQNPEKTNYLFDGWYTDKTLTNKYDFTQQITSNLTLYAKYNLDTKTLSNRISSDIIKGVVTIYNKSYNKFLGIETSSTTSKGSGFCFHIQDGFYYLLASCHLTKQNSSYENQEITIEDYQGNTYKGYIYKNPKKSYSAISASHDLVCLYFKPSKSNVTKIPMSAKDISKNDDVITLSGNNSKSISYGCVYDYTKNSLSNISTSLSNVTFDVIYHNSYSADSTGGPLLNIHLNVIGINYAGNSSTGRGYAIPISRVKDFLTTYVYD